MSILGEIATAKAAAHYLDKTFSFTHWKQNQSATKQDR